MFKLCLQWQRLHNNAGDSDSHYLLALATLGGATLIEMILTVSHCPRWLRQVSLWQEIAADDFTNELRQCKSSIIALQKFANDKPGNTKGGSITVPLTSCLTG
jgi:hypothetical protein